MPRRTTHLLADLLAGATVLLLFALNPVARQAAPAPAAVPPQAMPIAAFSFGPYAALAMPQADPPDSPLLRVARRLHARLARQNVTPPPLSALVSALEEQRTLLHARTTVHLSPPDGGSAETWEADLQRYPHWMQAVMTERDAHFLLNPAAISRTLREENLPGTLPPVHVALQEIVEDGDLLRARTEDVAKGGIVLDVPTAVVAVYDALLRGTEAITLPLHAVNGEVTNVTGTDLGALALLGTGRSDFAGSPVGRIRNIHKALRTHVNNILVPPGATFSFNDTLGGPVTLSRGWYESKVIFEGVNLRMAPGGGICQASTTVFRAMLHAGLQEEERANHSIYVSYYEKHGVGIDATVFPGDQDLTFVNDTGNYLLLQAYDEGTEAVVHIYGTPDGRSVALRGPYFASSDFSDYPAEIRPPRSNEIAWIQQRTFADGMTEERPIFSRYITGVPKVLAAKYNALHASAAGTGSTLISER
ncbi:MAG: VanW family protein [Candidatus Peribacteraceae bacterium]|nr:VanW family protein [Candidatus Peribacteraceae bacterium]